MPAILVLDEATSHLDTSTEPKLERHLLDMPITRIMIAHRLTTVRDADLIVVLDAGAIVECGMHEALLAIGGVYAALVSDQLDGASRQLRRAPRLGGPHPRLREVVHGPS